VITNAVVLIDRKDTSQMYTVCRMKMKSVKEEFEVEFSEVGDLDKSFEVTLAMQAAARRFADLEGSIYVPHGKSFLTVTQEGEKYHVVQMDPFKGVGSRSVEGNRNFMKIAYLAHLEGLRLKLPVEYHFKVPIGHKNVQFYPTDPNNYGIGPMFSQSNGKGEVYALRLKSLKKGV